MGEATKAGCGGWEMRSGASDDSATVLSRWNGNTNICAKSTGQHPRPHSCCFTVLSPTSGLWRGGGSLILGNFCFRFQEFPEVYDYCQTGTKPLQCLTHTHTQTHVTQQEKRRVRVQERGRGGGVIGQTLTHSWPTAQKVCLPLSFSSQLFHFFLPPPSCGESSNSFQTRAAWSLIQSLWLWLAV